ncbi:MAG: hypothetical protein ACFFFC_00655 [Candidatus Thorarchaeota archaeon]
MKRNKMCDRKNDPWPQSLIYIALFFGLLMLLCGVIFIADCVGLFGRTVIERKVFENSYQRSASLKSQIATHKAALEEIRIRLNSPDLDKTTKYNLEAQAASLRIQIKAAKEQLP